MARSGPSGRVARPATIGNRIAPARFLAFGAVFALAWLGIDHFWPMDDWRDTAAMAFDAGALVFLVSLIPLLRECSAETMRRHAAENDANRVLILALTTLLTLIAMAAIAGEIKGAQSGAGIPMFKLVGTLLSVWLFANSVYALHYAHAYYVSDKETGKDTGGLSFPGTDAPGYWDFTYFAFTLGMTFQTSDTEIGSTRVRKIALLHCFAAFIFNIGVIAFTINVLGGSS